MRLSPCGGRHMQVPWEIRISLRRGTVYYMAERSLTSTEPHYFIVLNTDPMGDEALLLAMASSQIESVKRRRTKEPASTVVEIAEADYADFTKNSVIDCNNVFTKSLLELCEQWRKKEIVPKLDIPGEILARLTQGALDSRIVSETDKQKIRSAEIPHNSSGPANPSSPKSGASAPPCVTTASATAIIWSSSRISFF